MQCRDTLPEVSKRVNSDHDHDSDTVCAYASKLYFVSIAVHLVLSGTVEAFLGVLQWLNAK